MTSDRAPAATVRRKHLVKWTIFLAATACVALLCVLVLQPLFDVLGWSAALAIAFNPLHRYFVRKTGRVSLSALLCSVLVVVMVLMPFLLVSALAFNQFIALTNYLQDTFKNGFDLNAIEPLRRSVEWLAHWGFDATAIMNWISGHGGEIGRTTARLSLTTISKVSSGVVFFVFTIYAMFLMFRDGPRIVARIPDLLPFDRAHSETAFDRMRDVIYASVYGVVVIALIQGALCGVMFWLLGIPSAALWGALAVLAAVFPLVGAAAVWIPGAVYLLATGHWLQAVVLAVWGAAVISTIDNLLRPKLVGDKIGLSELVMFFALLGGLQLFGILGIVMGPMLFAVAASILDLLNSDDPLN
jgi:predicted PurR-regulated permease PerM